MSFNNEPQPLTTDVVIALERAFDSEWDSAPRGQKNYVRRLMHSTGGLKDGSQD